MAVAVKKLEKVRTAVKVAQWQVPVQHTFIMVA